MFQALINSQEIEVKSGTKNGKDWTIREQPCFVTMPNGEVRRFAFSLEANEGPKPNGSYEPKNSAYGGRFGIEISMRSRDWQPVAQAARKVA